MDRIDSTRAAQALKIVEGDWGCILTGTKCQLIAAGLVLDGHFPGDPGRNKRSISIKRAGPGEVKTIVRQGVNSFRVHQNYTAAQAAEFKDRHEEAEADARHANLSARCDAMIAAGVPAQARRMSTAEGRENHKDSMLGNFMWAVTRMWNFENDPQSPWHYDEETLEIAKDLVGELASLYRGAKIRVVAARNAQDDVGFQKFMGAMMSKGGATSHG